MKRKQILITESGETIIADWHNWESIDEGINALKKVIKQAKEDKKGLNK